MIAPGKLKRKTPGSGAGPSAGFAVRYRKKNRNLTSFMPLPRKQTMNGNEVSSTWVMISLTHFKAERKGDLIVIISQEIIRYHSRLNRTEQSENSRYSNREFSRSNRELSSDTAL